MPSTYGRRSRSRPLGVTVLCLLGALGAVPSLLKLLGLLGGGGVFGLLALPSLVIVVGKLLVLFGLWTMREWGYRWAVALYSLSALWQLVTGSLGGVLLNAFVVLYLLLVADHFR